jgi:hypothetical protein
MNQPWAESIGQQRQNDKRRQNQENLPQPRSAGILYLSGPAEQRCSGQVGRTARQQPGKEQQRADHADHACHEKGHGAHGREGCRDACVALRQTLHGEATDADNQQDQREQPVGTPVHLLSSPGRVLCGRPVTKLATKRVTQNAKYESG